MFWSVLRKVHSPAHFLISSSSVQSNLHGPKVSRGEFHHRRGWANGRMGEWADGRWAMGEWAMGDGQMSEETNRAAPSVNYVELPVFNNAALLAVVVVWSAWRAESGLTHSPCLRLTVLRHCSPPPPSQRTYHQHRLAASRSTLEPHWWHWASRFRLPFPPPLQAAMGGQ